MTSALVDLPVYQPSGRIGLRAWAVFALLGVPLFLVLGWVYANVLALSPATPLDVIVVLLFWLCLFWAAMSIADRSHSRSARFSQAAGFLLGLAAWWMQWIVTLKSHGLDAQALAFANAGPLGWLQVLRDFAAWMVATREASASALTVLWSIEALAMLSIPAVMAKSCARQPYSETCRAWARSAFTVELYAAGAASTMLPQLLQERGVDALHQMRPAVQFDVQPRELPAPRIDTAYLSALEQAGETSAAVPLLERLAAMYRALPTQDDTFVWSQGLPFFAEFLRKSLPILRAASSGAQVTAWYQKMRHDLDANAQAMLDAHMRELAGADPAR